MKTVPFTAYPRTLSRRGGAKKLRANHRVPAVIYGHKTKPQNLEVETATFQNLLHHSASENILLDLALENDKNKHLVLVKEIQHHPLSGRLLHVDLHEVFENEKVTIMVPVETVGEAEGVKTDGGVLEHVLFKIKVRALPKDLPEVLEINVEHLKIGDSIHLGDIKPPAGVEVLGDKHISVISVAAPISEEQEAALEAEAAAASGEVEMIKEKKEGEEEGAAPAAAGKAAPGAAAPAAAGKAAPGAASPAGKAGAAAPAGKGAATAPAAAGKAPAAAAKPEKKKK